LTFCQANTQYREDLAMRRTSFYCLLLSLFVIPAVGGEPANQAMSNNAVLIGWDGAHRDHVKALLKEGKLPNLQKLVAQGTLVDIDVTSGATDTKAGWTQILTGYKPAVTGVYNNGRYRDVPAGYSIFERLRAQYGADQIATVATIGKKGHCGEINAPFKRLYDPAKDDVPEKPAPKQPKAKKAAKKAKLIAESAADQPAAKQAKKAAKKAQKAKLGRVVEEGGTKYLVFEGSPYYTMHESCNEWHFGLMQDEKVGDKALDMFDRYGKKPFFFFVHFAEVDHSGHKHGEPSQEYNDAIISGDKQLGRIVEKLKRLGVTDKTLIYVTADHGFDVGGKGHRNAPYVFLGTNDKQIMRSGTRADITPTILDRLGVDLGKITPPLDGESLAKPAAKPVGTAGENPDRKPPKKPAAKPNRKQKVAAA
jgi:arylsulfatase A-like enzyme